MQHVAVEGFPRDLTEERVLAGLEAQRGGELFAYARRGCLLFCSRCFGGTGVGDLAELGTTCSTRYSSHLAVREVAAVSVLLFGTCRVSFAVIMAALGSFRWGHGRGSGRSERRSTLLWEGRAK